MLNNDIYFLIVDYYGTIYSFNSCKGQCHEIFDTFSLHKKTSPGPHMNKTGFSKLFLFTLIFAKNNCLRSQLLRQHTVSVVNNYADIVSA